MKPEEAWVDEDLKRISKERGVIATREAWIAGFEFAVKEIRKIVLAEVRATRDLSTEHLNG
jgi:hypothetical protein